MSKFILCSLEIDLIIIFNKKEFLQEDSNLKIFENTGYFTGEGFNYLLKNFN